MKYFLLVLALFSTQVFAAPLYCSGKIKKVYIDSNGNVTIYGAWRNNWTRICNTHGEDTVNCSLWASYAATAVKEDLKVTVSYLVDDGSTCATLPTYQNTPKTNYVMIYNPVP